MLIDIIKKNRGIYAFIFLNILITVIIFLYALHISGTIGTFNIKVEGAYYAGTTFLSLAGLAYFFGLRHALDIDHIAAIDNSSRKLVQENKDSRYTGLFFSLGHSTIVFILSIAVIFATKYIIIELPSFESVGSLIGVLVSSLFLYIIAAINIVILIDIWKVFKSTEKEKNKNQKSIEEKLLRRGFMGRMFPKVFNIVKNQKSLYPIGLLFGLGFDTASEVALLIISSAVTGIFSKLPLYVLIIFPALFTIGMSLIDTTEGYALTRAYKWAFSDSLKRIWYNMTMTSTSIVAAISIATIEFLAMIGNSFNLHGTLWYFISMISNNYWEALGVLLIIGFIFIWGVSYILYNKHKQHMLGNI